MNRVRRAVVLSLAVLAASAGAQSFRGGVQGLITDATGGALPGATVAIKSAATGLSRTTTTDGSGNYAFPELPPGNYDVSASLPGFVGQTVKAVHVDVSATRRINLELAAGGLSERVEVSAAAALVNTTSNVQGGTLQGEQVAELPVNGRDFTKVLSLVPGANADPSSINDSPGSFGLFSANGQRGRSNNYLLDGTDMNDGYRNLPAINQGGVFGTPSTILPVDAVQEFPVLSGAQAEYGRNAGAIVNIVTRSGGNDFHGSLFEYFRDDSLGARNYFNTEPNPKNEFRNNQFGASLGGPLVKDRTFFFLAYEGQRENGGLPGLARVPTAAELAAAAAAVGGLNPVIAGLLARNPWPAPNQVPDAAGNNLVATVPFDNRVDSLIAKIDHHMGEGDLLTVRYFLGDSDQSFPLALVGGGGLPGYNTTTPTNVQLLSGSYTRVVSPKLLFELRGGFNRFKETFAPEDGDFDPGTIGLDTVDDPVNFGLPTMLVSGYATIGANTSLPRGRVDKNWQLFGNVSYNTGRHRVKAGYEFRRTTVDGYFNAGYRGRLAFDSLEEFVAGRPSGGRQARGDSRRFTSQDNHSLYLQDSWQVSRRLTFDLGLRWDYYGVIGERDGLFSRFEGGRVVPVDQLYGKDFNNFGPRFSAIYDLDGSGGTVLRAGYGVYHDAFSQDFFVGQLPWNTFNPGAAYNDVEFSFSPVSQIVSGQPVFGDFAATDVFTVDPDMRTPYVQMCNVNLQRQLEPQRGAAAGLRRLAGPQPVPLPRHQPARPGHRRGPLPGLHLHQPVRGHGQVQLPRPADGSAALLLARAELDPELHLVALDRHRQRRPGLRPQRGPARRQHQPRAREGQLELRLAPPPHLAVHLGAGAGEEQQVPAGRLGRQRRGDPGQRHALWRQLPVRGRLQRQRRVLRPARPGGRPLRGRRHARPLPEPGRLPGPLHPRRRRRLRGRPALRRPGPQRLHWPGLPERRPVAGQEHGAREPGHPAAAGGCLQPAQPPQLRQPAAAQLRGRLPAERHRPRDQPWRGLPGPDGHS